MSHKKVDVLLVGEGVMSSTLAALLGASPGASTAVQAMIEVIERCFKPCMKSADWKRKMKEMVPSYGESLDENVALLNLETVVGRSLVCVHRGVGQGGTTRNSRSIPRRSQPSP